MNRGRRAAVPAARLHPGGPHPRATEGRRSGRARRPAHRGAGGRRDASLPRAVMEPWPRCWCRPETPPATSTPRTSPTTYRRRNPGTRFVGLGGPAMRGRRRGAGGRPARPGRGRLARAAGQRRAGWPGPGARSPARWSASARTWWCWSTRRASTCRWHAGSGGAWERPSCTTWRPRCGPGVPGRIRKIAARVDRLAVLFPFEPDVYRGSGVTGRLRRPSARRRAAGAGGAGRAGRGAPGAGHRSGRPGGGPAARAAGATRSRPTWTSSSRRHVLLARADPGMRFLLGVAPSLAAGDDAARATDRLHATCARRVAEGLPLRLCEGGARETIVAADVVLAKPGTVTLECALLGRPMVVMGRANALTAWILRRALRVSSLTMPNLIAGEAVVPEFLQGDAVPSRLAAAVDVAAGGSRSGDPAGAPGRGARGPGPGWRGRPGLPHRGGDDCERSHIAWRPCPR